MTKGQAIDMLRRGHKVTHRFFSQGEYVKQLDGITYVFDDKMEQDADDFWAMRTDDAWQNDWLIFNEE